ncbi:MAG TPA: asparagine synthase (glutamine-hydrolyzing) [Stellaceae bacterium]|nr:asparagine synthase (glutamine-hydrolyzing) [Stellaceae bacterium]
MCGINGIFAYHAAAAPPGRCELLRTRDAMRRRGPDGSGAWWSADRRCALGHRRLSILDLSSRAAQPMTSADGKLAVTYNGEIYNYPELRRELEAEGAHFRTGCDTEVVLHLYARHGPAMVHRLRGMFAFAISDDQIGKLFLARDPYGIKPLYTANDGWTFRFASQVKALLAGGRISRDPEPAGLAGFYLFGAVPEPFTLYQSIRALPAGHMQIIDAGGPREPLPFASLAAVLAEGARDQAPAHELAETVRAGALDSVRAHLLADVEIGVFLSAGIDSGAVLGLLRDAGQPKMRAITLQFDEFRGTAEDEAPLAAEVAARYGAEHIVRRVERSEFERDLPDILDAMDQPSIDGVNAWFVAKAANEAGLKVALSGIGGDELLAGYPSFGDLPRRRRLLGPLAAVPGLGRLSRALLRALAPGFCDNHPKAAGLLEYSHSWADAYLLRRGLFLPYELNALLEPPIAREGLRRLRLRRRIGSALQPDPGSDIGRVCALESTHYLRNQLLRDADWAGMAHSVEIRVPLADCALLRTLAPVIPAMRAGAGKLALAKAPSTKLPDAVVARAKTGFGVPTGAWLETRETNRAGRSKGMASRRWSHMVLDSCGA